MSKQPAPASGMKTQAKVTIGIVVLLVAGLLGWFFSAAQDSKKEEKAIDQTSAPAVAPGDEASGTVDGLVSLDKVATEGIVLGERAEGDDVVQEFIDFECPICRQMQPTLESVLDEFDGKATISVRPWPLDGHPNSRPAWLAGLAAYQQGKFGEMYKKLFNTQDEWAAHGGDAEDQSARFRGYAEDLGLDMDVYDATVKDPATLKILEDSSAAAIAAGAGGTPAWVVNGEAIEVGGANTLDELSQATVDAIAKALEAK